MPIMVRPKACQPRYRPRDTGTKCLQAEASENGGHICAEAGFSLLPFLRHPFAEAAGVAELDQRELSGFFRRAAEFFVSGG